jgi:hypothetical protein
MKSMYWLGGLFVALGILSGVIGVVSYRNGQKQLAGYVQATATVSDWVPDPNYGTPDYCPKYEYTTQDGSTRSYIGSDCEAKPDPQTVGHQQEVIFYDPTNPYTDVATRGWTGSEGTPLIAGAIGLGFFVLLGLVMAIVGAVTGKKMPQQSAAGSRASRSSADTEQALADTGRLAEENKQRAEQLRQMTDEIKRKMEQRQRGK